MTFILKGPASDTTKPAKGKKVSAADRDRDLALRRTIRELEADTARLSADRDAIDRAMADPAAAETRFSRLSMTDLAKRRAELQSKIDATEARWLDAQEQLEAA